MLTAVEKQVIIKNHQKAAADVGSTGVQIALLTEDIKKLTEHFKKNAHDFHSRMGLTRKVNQRRRLLTYFRRINLEGYRELIKALGLRDQAAASK